MNQSTNQKVYVIVVNFNGHEDTIECLESVLKSDHRNFQIILVDNSTDPDSLNFITDWAKGDLEATIKTKYPEWVYPLEQKPISVALVSEMDLVNVLYPEAKLTIIKADENAGFASVNNLGITYAIYKGDGQWVWLLNNDTVVPQLCIIILCFVCQ